MTNMNPQLGQLSSIPTSPHSMTVAQLASNWLKGWSPRVVVLAFACLADAGVTDALLGIENPNSRSMAQAQLFRPSTRPPGSSTNPPTPPGAPGANVMTAPADPMQAETEAAYQRGDFPKALQLAEAMLARNPNNDIAIYLRGSARVELGIQQQDLELIRSGIEDARSALKVGGTDKINYYLPYLYGMTALAGLEEKREHAEVVIKFADSILARPNLRPEERANLQYQKAGAQVYLKNTEQAIASYLAAIQSSPQHLGAHVALASAYATAGKLAEAEAAFSNTTRVFPNNPLVFNNRGMYYQQQRKPKEAIADFSRAIQLDPRFYVAYTNRGFTYLNDGENPSAAIADFTESLRLNPQQPGIYSLRGAAKLQQGKLNEALADYNETLRLDPKNPIAMADIGFTKFFSKDYPAALASFNNAVLEDPNLRYLNPWRYLSMAYAGQEGAAAATFSDSLSKPVDKRDWMDQLVLFLAGKISEQELFNAAEPNDLNLRNAQFCEAYYFIGQQRLRAGNTAGANQFFEQALATKARYLSAYRGAGFALGKFAQ